MKSNISQSIGVGTVRVAVVLGMVAGVPSVVFALPLVTSIVQQGTGLNANAPIVSSAGSRLPQPEGPYTTGGLVDETFAYVTRTAEWTAVRTNEAGMLATAGTTLHPFPPYLNGLEYIQLAMENRTITDYALDITLSGPSKVYLFIDNRLNGTAGNNSSPNNTDPDLGGPLSWIVTDGWLRVNTGFMPNGQADYVGMDEGASVASPDLRSHAETAALIPGSGNGLNNFSAIYSKEFAAGTHIGLTKQQGITNANLFGIAFAPPSGPPLVLGDTNGNGVGGEFPDDFTPIQTNFRKPGDRAMGDLTGNGVIDFDDFRQWKNVHLGMGGSLAGLDLGAFGTSVPEPSTMVILLATVVAFAACRLGRRSV